MSGNLERRVQLLENALQQIMVLYEDALSAHDPVVLRAAQSEMVRIARMSIKGDDTEELRSILELRGRLVRSESALAVAQSLLRDSSKNPFMDTVRSLLGDAEAGCRLDHEPVLGDIVDGDRESFLLSVIGLQRLLLDEHERLLKESSDLRVFLET